MPGHAGDRFSLSQVMPEAAQAEARAGLLKARVCARRRHVALAGTPLPAVLPATPRTCAGQTGSAAQPGAALMRGAWHAKPDPELYSCLDLQTPGDFYPEMSWQLLTQCCKGVSSDRRFHRTVGWVCPHTVGS